MRQAVIPSRNSVKAMQILRHRSRRRLRMYFSESSRSCAEQLELSLCAHLALYALIMALVIVVPMPCGSLNVCSSSGNLSESHD